MCGSFSAFFFFLPRLIKFPPAPDCAKHGRQIKPNHRRSAHPPFHLKLSKSEGITYMAFDIYTWMAIWDDDPNLPMNWLTALLSQKYEFKFPQGIPQISSSWHGGRLRAQLGLFLYVLIGRRLLRCGCAGGSSSPHRMMGMQLSILLSNHRASAHARPHLPLFVTWNKTVWSINFARILLDRIRQTTGK